MSPNSEKPGSENYDAQLDWVKFCEETAAIYGEEPGSKFSRKFRENPFVPIGAFATTLALGYGLWCFRTGRSRQSQYMMRARIAAQGFTIVAILGSLVWGTSATAESSKPKPKPA